MASTRVPCQRAQSAAPRTIERSCLLGETRGLLSGYTALGLAANRGHTEVAAVLLSRRANPDTPICVNDATPLMIAVVWDRLGLG